MLQCCQCLAPHAKSPRFGDRRARSGRSQCYCFPEIIVGQAKVHIYLTHMYINPYMYIYIYIVSHVREASNLLATVESGALSGHDRARV